MKKYYIIVCLLLCGETLLACNGNNSAAGGSEFGNPTRQLQGTIVGSGESNLRKTFLNQTGDSGCPANQVTAIDSQDQVTSAEISQENCSFEMQLTANKSYELDFMRDDEFIATLVVKKNPSALDSTVFFIAEASTPMDLGDVEIENDNALPENQPASQNDQDDDGTDDFADEDDDGDGLSDDVEEDCDLDGFLDDYDQSDESCDSDADEGEENIAILEVSPSNEDTFVALDAEIWARFDCVVNQDSVGTETFSIAADNDSLSCAFDFSDSGDTVTCVHGDQDFMPDTVYTATVTGVLCEEGTEISSTSWSWATIAVD